MKNKSSAGWIVVAVLALAVILFLGWRETSNQQQEITTQQQALNLVSTNNCAANATTFFNQWISSNDPDAQTLVQGGDTPTYADHFNNVLQACLIRIDGSLLHTNQNGPEYQNIVEIYNVDSKASLAFMDAYSHKDQNYNLVFDSVDCSFASGALCKTTTDFDQGASALMSQ